MTDFAFIGPALGRHEGWVTTQGEILARLFESDGHRSLLSSTRLSPAARALDHARDIWRWRRQVDLAVVSVFSGRAFALADEALTLAHVLGVPTVACLRGGNLPEFGQRHPRWVRRVLQTADAVVAPTTYLSDWADTVVSRVPVIPNVLDLDRYRFRVRTRLRPRLLWMRTFQELYDPVCAVRVLAELRLRGVDATLTMAGQDKGLLDATQDLARQLDLGDRISFPGFASGPQKTELLDHHDVFLNTNLVDNAPVTVLEAAASGLVVVSTDVGGIPDLLVDGESARLVPPNDPAAMADAVEDVLEDPSQAARLVHGAHAVARRSSWSSVRAQWLELADELTRDSSAG